MNWQDYQAAGIRACLRGEEFLTAEEVVLSVLAANEHGLKREEIAYNMAVQLGVSYADGLDHVGHILSRLRSKGLVYPLGRGIWRKGQPLKTRSSVVQA